jgi:hypothetical protein
LDVKHSIKASLSGSSVTSEKVIGYTTLFSPGFLFGPQVLLPEFYPLFLAAVIVIKNLYMVVTKYDISLS